MQLLDALDAAKAAFAKMPRADAPRGKTILADFVPACSDPLSVIDATSLAPVDPTADFVPVDPDPLPLIDTTASTLDAVLAPAAAPSSEAKGEARPVILFDGVCLLCSGFIHFVLDHDKEGRFDFAPLQGLTGTALLQKHGLPLDVSTMVLIETDGEVHVRSTAALRVPKHCDVSYWLACAAIVLPRPLRDLGYKLVARYRYTLFGQDDGTS